jgi:23S rRNA pseudouridine2605 synthase
MTYRKPEHNPMTDDFEPVTSLDDDLEEEYDDDDLEFEVVTDEVLTESADDFYAGVTDDSETNDVESYDAPSNDRAVAPRNLSPRLHAKPSITLEEMFDFLPKPTHELRDGERLQKVLARAGIGSRRVCENLIEARRVRVNGEVAILGRRVDPEHDLVTVDGAPVGVREGLVYYLLNKPRGVVTTADDPQGRETVIGLVPAEPRVYPVGRLDRDTEGLLLMTNDGELAHRITHPSFGVEKEYLAEVEGSVSPSSLRMLRDGVMLEDGLTAPASVSLVEPNLVRIAIHEGRNRQVRRMLEEVGNPVIRLVRTRIGRVSDRSIPPGRWRHLRTDELRSLEAAVAGGPVEREPVEREPVES